MKPVLIKFLKYLINAFLLAFIYFKTKTKKTINLISKKNIYIIYYLKFFINNFQSLQLVIHIFLFAVGLFFSTKFLFFSDVSLMFTGDIIELPKIFIIFIKNSINSLLNFVNSIVSNYNLLQFENTILLLEKKELKPPIEIFQNIQHYKSVEDSCGEYQSSLENNKFSGSKDEQEILKLRLQIEQLMEELKEAKNRPSKEEEEELLKLRLKVRRLMEEIKEYRHLSNESLPTVFKYAVSFLCIILIGVPLTLYFLDKFN
jgi:signal transduction histidine kinase